MKKITIIGGGASGTLLAVNLLKLSRENAFQLNLVERQSRIGRGVAFGTSYDTHLLNVPAGRMGAFPDDVEHFYRWLCEKGLNFEKNDFVPRKIFGEYLRTLLETHAPSATDNVKLTFLDDEAVDMSVNGDSAEVMLRSGEILASHKVVLAFGNFKPPHPSVEDLGFTKSDSYFQDPWNSNLYQTIQPDDKSPRLAYNLSMVDAFIINKNNHRGKIYAISTRGLLPAAHKLGYTYPSFYGEIENADRITDILKTVRRHIKIAESTGSNWRAVIDSLRPATQKIWLDLPLAEKRYFMQHLSRYWNVARHRMPPEASVVIDEMRSQDKLNILRGRLKSIKLKESGPFDVQYSLAGIEHHVRADILVNCIGSQSNFEKIDSPFIKNLIKRNHIRNDELALGIKADPNYMVTDRTGSPSRVVYTLGTALKGLFWETTAVPEIREQARDLALRLLAD